MSYWTYYLLWLLLAYGTRQPWILLGIVLFVLLRRFIPAPRALWRALGRKSALERQVAVNASNVTARRDLALIYLELLRPRTALTFIEQARIREPNDPELLLLLGMTLHRCGRHKDALEPLVRAVEINPGMRFGMPYLVAGDALLALGQWEEAIDAYERYGEKNSSNIGVFKQLARAHSGKGDKAAARAAIVHALETWRQLPRTMRRGQRWNWLEIQWARVWLLRDPQAILGAAVLVCFGVLGAYACSPAFYWIRSPFRYNVQAAGAHASPWSETDLAPELDPETSSIMRAHKLCGTQDLGDFVGSYVLDVDNMRAQAPKPSSSASPAERLASEKVFAMNLMYHGEVEIKRDRINTGPGLVQEFCVTRVIERTAQRLRVEAISQDLEEPDDSNLEELLLERHDQLYVFAYGPLGGPQADMARFSLRKSDK